MQHKARKLGTREGCLVEAISDALGSHVVVSGETRHGMCQCASHKQAVALAKRVVKDGFDVCKWEKPPSTLAELAHAMVFAAPFQTNLRRGK